MRSTLLCSAIAMAVAGAAHGDLILVNGDFEVGLPTNGVGTGWTASHNDSAGGWRSSIGTDGDAGFILNSNGGSNDPTLSQTLVGLVIGETYEVAGYYASFHVNSAPNNDDDSFVVSIDDTAGFEAGPTGPRQYESFSFLFVAQSETSVLSIRGEANGSDNDFVVDDFSVVRVIPSPGTAALLALGGLGLRRRR